MEKHGQGRPILPIHKKYGTFAKIRLLRLELRSYSVPTHCPQKGLRYIPYYPLIKLVICALRIVVTARLTLLLPMKAMILKLVFKL